MKATGLETKQTVVVSSQTLKVTLIRVTGSTTASMESAASDGNQMPPATMAVFKTARRMVRDGTNGLMAATTRATLLTECFRDKAHTTLQTLERLTLVNSRTQTCMASEQKFGKTAKLMKDTLSEGESKAMEP